MAEIDQSKDQQQAQSEADKKVNIPENVSVGQAQGYDTADYTSRTDRHQELLDRFGVPTYAGFEEKLGTPFARAVVAYLLGDADHARVLGAVLISDPQQAAPGGIKAGDNEGSNPSESYQSGNATVSVQNGAYFVNGFKFAEKQKADLYALSLDNPKTDDSGETAAKPSDGAEKTALGADGEVGIADPVAQAQKEKDASGVTEQQDSTTKASRKKSDAA